MQFYKIFLQCNMTRKIKLFKAFIGKENAWEPRAEISYKDLIGLVQIVLRKRISIGKATHVYTTESFHR